MQTITFPWVVSHCQQRMVEILQFWVTITAIRFLKRSQMLTREIKKTLSFVNIALSHFYQPPRIQVLTNHTIEVNLSLREHRFSLKQMRCYWKLIQLQPKECQRQSRIKNTRTRDLLLKEDLSKYRIVNCHPKFLQEKTRSNFYLKL